MRCQQPNPARESDTMTAPQVRYITIPRTALEIAHSLPAKDKALFVDSVYEIFQQLSNGEEPHINETGRPFLDMAVRESIPEIETGYRNYQRRARGGKPANSTPMVNQCPTNGQPMVRNSREENRREEIRKEGEREESFPPTLEEIREYCRENGLTCAPEGFIDYYDMNGWKTNAGQPVQDWKAALRNWERREPNGKHNFNTGKPNSQSASSGRHYSD